MFPTNDLRHNLWVKVKQWRSPVLIKGTLNILSESPGVVRLQTFDVDCEPKIWVPSIAHVREPAAVTNPPDAYKRPLKNLGGGHDAADFANIVKRR